MPHGFGTTGTSSISKTSILLLSSGQFRPVAELPSRNYQNLPKLKSFKFDKASQRPRIIPVTMFSIKLIILVVLTQFLGISLPNPIMPSLQHRQLGSCASSPCGIGYCCSQYAYCGTGLEYCQTGSCKGGVGGTCAEGLCCSPYGYCGTGVAYCASGPLTPTPTSTSTSILRSTLTCVRRFASTSASIPSTTSPSSTVNAGTVSHWNQCGGQDWGGGTVCVAPYVCTFSSIWYSDCR
jgi:hypothetical protein